MDIEHGKITFDKGGIIRNGTALHLDQGIAVTTHASQAKSVVQVNVSVQAALENNKSFSFQSKLLNLTSRILSLIDSTFRRNSRITVLGRAFLLMRQEAALTAEPINRCQRSLKTSR